ncbi:hypothetical protein FACS1894125_0770 [Actinomycetota bacterium]|nr:hypothetical protein FACS1894125_0770 [Actinomycetota bacterium]
MAENTIGKMPLIAKILITFAVIVSVIFGPSISSFLRLKIQDGKASRVKEMTNQELVAFLYEQFPDSSKGCLDDYKILDEFCDIRGHPKHYSLEDSAIFSYAVFDDGNYATDEFVRNEGLRRRYSNAAPWGGTKVITLYGYNWQITALPDVIYRLAQNIDGVVVDNSCFDNIFCRVADNIKEKNGWKWRPNGEKWPTWEERRAAK